MSTDESAEMDKSLEALFDFADQSEPSDEVQDYPLLEELQDNNPRYQNTELIAQGGMKTVTKVFDNKTGRYVAMAKLHSDAPKELYEPFLREAKLTAQLDHPNIISIHEIGLDEEQAPYFTMELKSGQGLHDIIKAPQSSQELNKLLEIFLKVCDGISYAHSRQTLHLDIKAENIQAGLYGDVIICDWGLGKLIGDPAYDGGDFDRILLNPDLLNNMTLADEVRGTPGFMAPEQINDKEKVSTQTDVYSLGALLYLILTQTAPVEISEKIDDILKRTIKGEIISPQKRFPDKHISASLSAVCMKALSTKPANRYPTVEELRNDIYNCLTGHSSSAENAGFLTEAKLFYKRNKNISQVIISSLLIIIFLSSYFVSGLKKSIAEADLAKNVAEENQQIAIGEKERAEDLLKLYKEEQAKLSRLIEDHYKILKDEVYQITDIRMFENPELWSQKAISTLDRMIDGKTTETWPYMQRGYVYFITQDLKKVIKDLGPGNSEARHFAKLSLKYQDKAKEGKILDIDTFMALLSEMGKKTQRSQVLMMLRYDATQRQSLSDHAKAVQEVLAFFNEGWDKTQFSFDSNKLSLKLRGKELTHLATNSQEFSTVKTPEGNQLSLIKTLSLKSLDIQHTGITELSQLAGLSMTELDIRHTEIKKFRRIAKQLPTLQVLTVSEGQIPSSSPLWQSQSLKIKVE